MRVSVITFPGSNCDHDSFHIPSIRNHEVQFIWHKDSDLKNPDLVIIPGGFSYGDYLRCGAIAKFSPIIQEVIEFGNKGGLIIGICNGFQILTECGLLPGTLMVNESMQFICQHQFLSVTNNTTPFTNQLNTGQVIDIPIAHKEGNYFIGEDGLNELIANNQIVFQYCDAEGKITREANPNGAINNIAGIINKEGNILGMMPHPERAAEDIVGSQDGKFIFASMENYFKS